MYIYIYIQSWPGGPQIKVYGSYESPNSWSIQFWPMPLPMKLQLIVKLWNCPNSSVIQVGPATSWRTPRLPSRISPLLQWRLLSPPGSQWRTCLPQHVSHGQKPSQWLTHLGNPECLHMNTTVESNDQVSFRESNATHYCIKLHKPLPVSYGGFQSMGVRGYP